MALPSSGAISISQIRSELGTSDGSLRNLSALAGKSTPDAMSEFYGYSNAVTVNIDLYYPTYVGCNNLYTFAVQSSQTVNTNVLVTISWYGDLGGYFDGTINLLSGTFCRSASLYSGGGVNCYGEYNQNLYWSMSPTSNGGQNYFPNQSYGDLVPC
jgi:hypothetical protein